MRNFQTEQPSPLCVHYSTSAEIWSRCYRMRYTTFHLFRGCCNLFSCWFCCLSCEFTVNNKSPIWDYIHPDDQTQPTFGHFQVTETHIFKTRLYSCENEFQLHNKKNHFHISSFALNLTLKPRLGKTPKWSVAILKTTLFP